MSRNVLMLWRWSEALACEGDANITGSVGGQMRSLKKGDHLFVCATSGEELYLLGLLQVRKVERERDPSARDQFGDHRALCRNLSGVFKILPLGKQKWQLRFVNTKSDRLDPNIKLAMQVRAHRFLSEDSADLLLRMLGDEIASVQREQRYVEGERRAAKMARTVRSAALRLAAKHRWGLRCYCCGFSFEEFYGAAGEDFAIIHHLDPLGDPKNEVRETSVEDVRILCANCHYIVHRQEPATKVETLKRQVARQWTAWTSRGVRAR